MREAIVLGGLTKYYNHFLALDSLTLKIENGESVALLGPNGAGKTTALKIICGVLRPTRGEVYVWGKSVLRERERALSEIGAILETPEFYPFLTAAETLEYLGRLRGVPAADLSERIRRVLEMVKLQEWKDVKVGKFSRGMKQRLALAQAFLHDPPVLVLDEPTLGLDPRGVAEVREILRAERGKKTILFATHQLPEAVQVCEKIAIIEGGKLRAYQGLGELKRRFGSLEKAYLKLTGATV